MYDVVKPETPAISSINYFTGVLTWFQVRQSWLPDKILVLIVRRECHRLMLRVHTIL